MNAPDVDLIRYGFAYARKTRVRFLTGMVGHISQLQDLRTRNRALANQVMAGSEEAEMLRDIIEALLICTPEGNETLEWIARTALGDRSQ